MEINYNVKGESRKKLVKVIADTLGVKSKYNGAPTMAYEVGDYTIDRNGTLIIDAKADSKEVERLLDEIAKAGFDYESSDEEIIKTEVAFPREQFSDLAIANLEALISAKANLIRKALGVEDLNIVVTDIKVVFPWFEGVPQENFNAYIRFISALCEMAKNAKRITAKEREVENEKYAFRCFLLRLGYIGDESKADRKILLRNLEGSSAFKSGAKKEYAPGLDPIPTPENTVKFDVDEAMRRLQDPDVQSEIRTIINGEDGGEE